MVYFGVGAPPILGYLSGDWHVHWGYGLLTHGQLCLEEIPETKEPPHTVRDLRHGGACFRRG